MDRGEYDVCSYCGKSIFPGVAQCPYCGRFTDEQGPLGLQQQRRIPRIFVILGWVALVAFVLPLVYGLFVLLRRWVQ